MAQTDGALLLKAIQKVIPLSNRMYADNKPQFNDWGFFIGRVSCEWL